MLFKKFLTSVICSLMVTGQLLGQTVQAKPIIDVVQARNKNNFFRMGKRIFGLPRAGITSLSGIERIAGIDRAWFIGLGGNKVRVLKANSFNFPVFKNLIALDLSNNGMRTIEPGASKGLESVRFLWLGGNKLKTIPDGALQGLDQVKFVFLRDNPGAEELQKQVQKQLPQANVYRTTVASDILKTAALAAGIAAAAVAVVLTAISIYQRPAEAPKGMGAGRKTPGESEGEGLPAEKIDETKSLQHTALKAREAELLKKFQEEFPLPEDSFDRAGALRRDVILLRDELITLKNDYQAMQFVLDADRIQDKVSKLDDTIKQEMRRFSGMADSFNNAEELDKKEIAATTSADWDKLMNDGRDAAANYLYAAEMADALDDAQSREDLNKKSDEVVKKIGGWEAMKAL